MGKVTNLKTKSLEVQEIQKKRMVGRPKKLDITDAYTQHQLKMLGRYHCTQREIAAMFRVTISSLQEWFEREPAAKALFEEGMAEGKMSVRRAQFMMAQRNPVSSIWWGKNNLEQTDKTETKVTNDVNVNVRHSVHELFDKIEAMSERGKVLTNGNAKPGDDAKPVN